MPADPWTLSARWIIPVDRPPLTHGTITIQGERIIAVEPAGTRTPDRDLGNAAILPGFVNAHTHLDLTGMRGKCPPTDAEHFMDWLKGVIAFRRSQTVEQVQADIAAGVEECRRSGTTLLGDISTQGDSFAALTEQWTGLQSAPPHPQPLSPQGGRGEKSAPIRSVVFREFLGSDPRQCIDKVQQAIAWLISHKATPDCRPGLSPHAPYSTSLLLSDALGNVARMYQVPLATHMAETQAELQLIRHRTGHFIDFLRDLGIANLDGLAKKLTLNLRPFRGVPHGLLIHCNYLALKIPIPPSASIVYCPRTHSAFGHPLHPFRDFLARGVRVALGTDSLASNPDLDILAEARFIHGRYPDVPGEIILRMLTLSGAEALGWADETGSLTPGKSADLVVLPLPDRDDEPERLVLESSAAVRSVLFRGEWTVGNKFC